MIHYSYTQHISGRDSSLHTIGDSALNVLAPALVHEGTAQIWAHVAPKLALGTLWGASVCVCLLSEMLLLKGETSNMSLCL